MLSRHRAHQGFTLVEIMVALAIVTIMLLLGLPSMSSYLQSSKLATEAQNFQTGLQVARTEAIRRNQVTTFTLTDQAVTQPNMNAALAAPSNVGRNWMVTSIDPTRVAPNNIDFVDSKDRQEGAGSTASSIQVTGTIVPAGAFNGVVQFNGMGATSDAAGVANGLQYRLAVINPAGGACVANGGPMRCLDVRVMPGGRVKVCDPVAAAGDSRAC